MTFAAPWMLFGTLGALIPLLIHLFDRRKPRPHPFGPIAFVLRSQRRTASRLKLKRLLLYALRTLILLAVPLALAKPRCGDAAGPLPIAKGPAATVLVLDASLSMRYVKGRSLFEKARDETREALKALGPEEPATLLVCNSSPTLPSGLGFDRAQLRARIDEAQPTYEGADLSRCLEVATRALEDSPVAGKRLVLISDLTAAGWHLDRPAPTVRGPTGEMQRPELVLRDAAGSEEPLPNYGLFDLKVSPALQAGPKAYQFNFTVKNFSPSSVKDVQATLRVGQQVLGKGFVDVPAGGTVQKSLTVRFDQGGTVMGELGLTPDALAEDDRRAFVLPVPRTLKALIINGSPHATRYRDEAFFVEAALSAPGSPVHAALRDTEAGLREDFSAYDLIFLLNVPAPSPEAADRLSRFVEAGGGLFLSMGDTVDADAYNQRLAALLPRRLRLVKTSAEREERDAESKATKLSQVSMDHPLFAPFTGTAGEGLLDARFYRYMLLEAESPGAEKPSDILATYEDGAPAVAVARRGKGRVAFYTSTVDRDWSDAAIRTSFLPLMQRFAAFLAGTLDERAEQRARVGERFTLTTESGAKPNTVKAPSGASVPLQAQADGTWQVGPLREPGLHTVLESGGKSLPELAFAATLDPAESDLGRISTEQLSAHFGTETVKATGNSTERAALPLWTWLFVAAAGAFFLEGLLLRK